MSDRRVVFFALAALLCMALAPITFAEHRWVPEVVGTLYALFALAAWLDHRSRVAHDRRRNQQRDPV